MTELASGGISLILPPGAAISAGGTLYVAREAVGFRARSVSPRANQKRYVVSGSDFEFVEFTYNDGGTDYFAFTFRRQKNALDVSYVVEMSSDLVTWATITTVMGTPSDNGDRTEERHDS